MFCWLCITALLVLFATYIFSRSKGGKRVNVRDKGVLITGCDTGFGKLLAEELAKLKAIVFAGCLSESSEGARELSKLDHVTVLQLDVTKQDQVDRAVSVVEESLRGKDLWAVVNNAGIGRTAAIEICDMPTFYRITDVNYFGTVRVTKAFLPLVRGARGRIVNISSTAGSVGTPGFSAYSASKAAVDKFTDSLRREMKPFDVKVSALLPHLYKTPLLDTKPNEAWIRTTWAESTEDIKTAYTSDYLDEFIRKQDAMAKSGLNDMTEVIDAMLDAVAGVSPKDTYVQPSYYAYLLALFTNLPNRYVDLYMKI